MTWDAQVQSALAELRARTKQDIETETAWKWAARAAGAVRLADAAPGTLKLRWLAVAVEYGHEAIEHAASAHPGVLANVQERLSVESPGLFGE